MALSINLLKKTKALSERQYSLEKKIVKITLIFFLIIVAFTIALFVWLSILSVSISTVEKKIDDANSELAGLQTASVMQLYIKSRLNLVAGFLQNRAKTRESLQRIFSLPLEGVTVSSAVFEDETHLKIQLTTNSIKTFDQAYSLFENSREFFVDVVNNGVTQAEDGAYTTSLTLTLPKGLEDK